jgi:DNA transformation protein
VRKGGSRGGRRILVAMRKDEGLLSWLAELLEPQGRVALRRMFGGNGLYLDGVFVAIVIDGRPYFKADALTQAAFVEAGGEAFMFESRGRRMASSYWSVPESAFDSAEDMAPWARRALAAARRKPPAKGRKKVRDAPA